MLDIHAIRQLSKQGQHQQAINAANKLVKSDAKNTAFLDCYGFVLITAGDFGKAIKVYQKLIRLFPNKIDYLFALAICHTNLNNFKEAQDHYLKLIALQPDDFKYKMNYGVLLREHGHYDEAETYLKKAHENNPQFAEILHNLAINYERQEQFTDSLNIYDQVLAIDPNHYRALSNQGHVYIQMDDLNKAEEKFKASLAINPQYNNGLNNLGLMHLYKGEMDQAKSVFHEVIKTHPYDGKGYFNLSNLNNLTGDELADVITGLEARINNNEITAFLDKGLFALAQFYQKQKNTQKLEAYYLKGNQVMARQRIYDHHKTQQEFKHWHDFSMTQPVVDHPHQDQKVIFIIGMPRSGTTLLESVLASHPDISAGDELPYLNESFNKALKNLPSKIMALSAENLAEIVDRFHQKTERLYQGKKYLIDKLPHNFKWAPLIAQLFPQSKIIHCYRDAMDNCWSLFRANFEQGHEYCFNMRALGQYYAQYQHLMQAYEAHLGEKMLSLCYDDLVQNPQEESRRIFDYLGMGDFEFDESKRGEGYFSTTASAAQVQDQISTKSLQGWRRHDEFLKPVLAALQKQQARLGLPVYQD